MMTNFDDIPFAIEADPYSGVYTDWTIEPIVVRQHVPYSSIWISETIGYEPARVAWRLTFDRKDDYYAMLARLNTVGTLTVLAGFQSLKGTQETHGNPPRVYEVLDNVQIAAITSVEFHVGGHVECSVAFERMVDPVTRLAVT